MQARSEFLQQFLSTLKNQLSDPELNGASLAEELDMSRMHLHRHLQRYFGKSARELILRARLEHAKKMLRDKNLTVKHIARKTGYRDPAYFSRVFRKEVGYSPRQYREQEEE